MKQYKNLSTDTQTATLTYKIFIVSHAYDARTNSFSLNLQASFKRYSDEILAHIIAVQNFGYAYTITGDIMYKISLFSSHSRLSGIKAINLQAQNV